MIAAMAAQAASQDVIRELRAEIARLTVGLEIYKQTNESLGIARLELTAERDALRSAIIAAHGILTKSSLVPSERVHDATSFLSRDLPNGDALGGFQQDQRKDGQ